MLPISLARHSSSMPMQRIAFQRRCETQQCSSFACRINALASLSTCFFAPRFSAPLHVLWPLSPRSAGHTPAIPQHVLASHSQTSQVIANAFLRSAIASRCRSFPLQFLALPSLSIAEHSLAAADRSCSAAYRSFALANRSTSELRHCASARYSSMQFLGNSRHCHANATLSLLSQSTAPQSSPLLFHRSAHQCSAAAVVRHAAAYAP